MSPHIQNSSNHLSTSDGRSEDPDIELAVKVMEKPRSNYVFVYLHRLYDSNGNHTDMDRCVYPKVQTYEWSLLLAVIIIIFLSVFKRRKNVGRQLCNGRPGLLVPMNALDVRQSRVGYILAFGASLPSILSVFNEEDIPFSSPGDPKWVKSLLIILAALNYGTIWYPFFAVINTEMILGYVIGIIYAVVHFCVSLVDDAGCYKFLTNPCVIATWILYKMQTNIFFVLLTIYYFYLIIKQVRGGRRPSEVARRNGNRLMADYVKNLLGAKTKKSKIQEVLETVPAKYRYSWTPGFIFSPRLLCSLFVSASVIYFLYLISFSITISIRNVLSDELLVLTEERSMDTVFYEYFVKKKKYVSKPRLRIADMNRLIMYSFYVVLECTIVALYLSLIVTIIHFPLILKSHKRTILMAYKGQYPNNVRPSTAKCPSALSSYISLAGYQVAYFVFGSLIVWIFLFSCNIFLSAIIIYWRHFGPNAMRFFEVVGPLFLVMEVVVLIKYAMYRKIFTEDPSVFGIDNRRLLSVWAYYIFFYDVFIGALSSLKRMFMSIVIGAFFVSRIDMSIFLSPFERFDSGYRMYCNFVGTEVALNHPILRTFINILVGEESASSRNDDLCNNNFGDRHAMLTSGFTNSAASLSWKPLTTRQRRIRMKWQLFYTLLNNPTLTCMRKHKIKEQLLEAWNLSGI